MDRVCSKEWGRNDNTLRTISIADPDLRAGLGGFVCGGILV